MITLLTAAEVSEGTRAFLAAVSVAPDVLDLRPDYRVLVLVAEGLAALGPQGLTAAGRDLTSALILLNSQAAIASRLIAPDQPRGVR